MKETTLKQRISYYRTYKVLLGSEGEALMWGRDRDLGITKNIRWLEWLKSELLTSVADLFRILASGGKASQEVLADCLASIIIACYLLGKRLGIHFALIDQKVGDKVRLGILEEHDVEINYGDLSALQQHMRDFRE